MLTFIGIFDAQFNLAHWVFLSCISNIQFSSGWWDPSVNVRQFFPHWVRGWFLPTSYLAEANLIHSFVILGFFFVHKLFSSALWTLLLLQSFIYLIGVLPILVFLPEKAGAWHLLPLFRFSRPIGNTPLTWFHWPLSPISLTGTLTLLCQFLAFFPLFLSQPSQLFLDILLSPHFIQFSFQSFLFPPNFFLFYILFSSHFFIFLWEQFFNFHLLPLLRL